MSSLRYFLSGATLAASLIGAQAVLDVTSSDSIALYWGQNSYGQGTGDYVQRNLSYYCQNSDVDVFQLAFVTVINGPGGVPEINFANIGDSCTTFEGTSLLNCPQVGEDIKTCQAANKTILLSIGGATYSEGGFTSATAATAGAKLIWDTFGANTNDSALRPFGDAVVDGFDFDFEANVANMATFGNALRSLMDADTSKEYFLTAAPQCVYPDAADKEMLDGAVSFDAIFVQFYNNYCGVNHYSAGATTQNYNFETWDNWAKNVSANPDVKVFVGVPGNTGAAGSGYMSASDLKPILEYSAQFSSFGGVMIWDASQAYANSGFISGVASDMNRTSNTSNNGDGNTTSPTDTSTNFTINDVGNPDITSSTDTTSSTNTTSITDTTSSSTITPSSSPSASSLSNRTRSRKMRRPFVGRPY